MALSVNQSAMRSIGLRSPCTVHAMPMNQATNQLTLSCYPQQRTGVEEEEPVDVEGEFEEYEWAGQTRVRATSMLEGGFSGKAHLFFFLLICHCRYVTAVSTCHSTPCHSSVFHPISTGMKCASLFNSPQSLLCHLSFLYQNNRVNFFCNQNSDNLFCFFISFCFFFIDTSLSNQITERFNAIVRHATALDSDMQNDYFQSQ